MRLPYVWIQSARLDPYCVCKVLVYERIDVKLKPCVTGLLGFLTRDEKEADKSYLDWEQKNKIHTIWILAGSYLECLKVVWNPVPSIDIVMASDVNILSWERKEQCTVSTNFRKFVPVTLLWTFDPSRYRGCMAMVGLEKTAWSYNKLQPLPSVEPSTTSAA